MELHRQESRASLVPSTPEEELPGKVDAAFMKGCSPDPQPPLSAR
ncbi:MAG: hypothetical protein QW760_07320 [Thermofilaceae archaeon]